MIPDERFSTETVKGELLNPWSRQANLSRHWGPIALQDPSAGLMVKIWQMRAIQDGSDLLLSSSGVAEYVWYTHTKAVEQVSLAFDQNGLPIVAIVDVDGDAWLRWFDPTVPGYETAAISYATTPRVTLDDARQFNVANSDVILGYVREGVVRYRRQRDRFQDEYTPPVGPGGSPAPATALRHISMNSNLRLEFLTDDAGDEPWTLAEVVADLLRRSNLRDEQIDVRQLYSQYVDGYRVANEGGADSNIAPLQMAYFFDPGEWDKRLRFIMRGGDPVAHLAYDDLLERASDEGVMEIERVQQAELLRKVNVTMLDSTAGWVPNKQSAERRSATIEAVGESSTILPLTAVPDFTASVAVKRLRVPWAEPNNFKYSLGISWSALTPTDVISITDRSGRVYHQRIGQIEEDFGSFAIEATTNANWVYAQKAIGTSVPPSIPTVPGEAGATNLVVLDIPVMRDQDDELGYYVAVDAPGDGWNGGLLQTSLDGGATILQTLNVDVPSSVGETVTALQPEVSSEYLSDQVLRITLSDQPESITREDVLRYRNLSAVQHADGSWEVLQFATVTAVDATTFDLSGLVRGRYATSPGAVPAGARFVLLDNSVLFVQMQQWMIGETVSYRGVSYGQNADDVSWQSFVVSNPQTQTEWPVHHVKASRDGSNNVTVSWIGRARLGVEVAPYNSKYFGGYRVTYSDGFTADTTEMSHTRSAAPAGVTVTVAAINTITGLGPQSEGITV